MDFLSQVDWVSIREMLFTVVLLVVALVVIWSAVRIIPAWLVLLIDQRVMMILKLIPGQTDEQLYAVFKVWFKQQMDNRGIDFEWPEQTPEAMAQSLRSQGYEVVVPSVAQLANEVYTPDAGKAEPNG